MNTINKVSDITYQDIAEYIRLSEISPEDVNLLTNLLNIAKNFIKQYTGLNDLDQYQDLVIVVFALCQDMYDNRTLCVNNANLNKVIESILNMHSVNLLPNMESKINNE